jgi:ribosomal protein S18 acetylase RimI-like enzyme
MIVTRTMPELLTSEYASQVLSLARQHRPSDISVTLSKIQAEDPKARMLLCIVDERVVGMLRLHDHAIDMLHVQRQYRRMGYGKLLVQRAIDVLGNLSLEVEVNNLHAVDVYKSVGLVNVGTYHRFGIDVFKMSTSN